MGVERCQTGGGHQARGGNESAKETETEKEIEIETGKVAGPEAEARNANEEETEAENAKEKEKEKENDPETKEGGVQVAAEAQWKDVTKDDREVRVQHGEEGTVDHLLANALATKEVAAAHDHQRM